MGCGVELPVGQGLVPMQRGAAMPVNEPFNNGQTKFALVYLYLMKIVEIWAKARMLAGGGR